MAAVSVFKTPINTTLSRRPPHRAGCALVLVPGIRNVHYHARRRRKQRSKETGASSSSPRPVRGQGQVAATILTVRAGAPGALRTGARSVPLRVLGGSGRRRGIPHAQKMNLRKKVPKPRLRTLHWGSGECGVI